LQELLQLLLDHGSRSISSVDFAAAYARADKLCQSEPALAQSEAAQQLLQQLDQWLPTVQQQMDTRELSNIVWSCAYTQYMAPVAQLWSAFMQPSVLSGANSYDIANMLWSLATLDQQVSQQQVHRLSGVLVGQAGTAAPQAISNSLWAVGKLGHQVPQQQLGVLLAAFTAEACLAGPPHKPLPTCC
jgi:hypothetical protein